MSRNANLSAARGWAHDRLCVGVDGGYCAPGDSEHARRTVHPFAREIVDARTPEQRAAAVHRLLCIGAARGECQAEAHLVNAARIADQVPVPLNS